MPDVALDAARRQLGLSYMDLWIDYFALGGNLDGMGSLPTFTANCHTNITDHNIIAHALNERFRDAAKTTQSPTAPAELHSAHGAAPGLRR